jgi:hypothetical protein
MTSLSLAFSWPEQRASMGDASMKDVPTRTLFFGPFEEPEAHLFQFKDGAMIVISPDSQHFPCIPNTYPNIPVSS